MPFTCGVCLGHIKWVTFEFQILNTLLELKNQIISTLDSSVSSMSLGYPLCPRGTGPEAGRQ
jgi:hypothetical protein